ncbi:NAD(P)/FAD-dependent oxidoreductase [Roseococcus pinisoli]|uniref:FAD-binding oxidoreductase n=1 Tax=Roseococcus pinisoli TaxID=2835040 RepID=A0ABS5QI29_9PROT|nr:FAD-binding oxidoreductase [Roseococcus pinisoli]
MPLLADPISGSSTPPAQADVVIIGGGIVGVCAALTLAKAGHSVALVEKGVVGGEQSSRNWGWVRQQNRDPREIPMAMESLAMWERLSQETNEDLGFQRKGLIYVTKDPATLATWEAWGRIAKPFGVDTRMLGAAEARAMATGTADAWIGGVYSPTDGKAEPSLAAPALARAAMRLGAVIVENCAARGLDLTAGRVSGVVTEKGTIRTASVLLAGGAWASMFLRHHGVSLPQASIRSTSFRTEPLPEVVTGGLSTPKFTLRRRLDGGYTIGLSGRGRLELAPQGFRYARQFWPMFMARRDKLAIRLGRSFFDGPEAMSRWSLDGVSPFERIRMLDPAPQQSLIDEALVAMGETYPELKGRIRVAQSWGGAIDWTPDGIPVIAPLARIPGLTVAAGFSGHGFGTGPSAGKLAADLVTGATPSIDPTPFRYERLIDGSDLTVPGMI